MPETQEARPRTQGRSPPFPFIPLEKAIEQARKFESHSNGHLVRVASAVQGWGYKPGSSGGLQTVSALKAFGLLSDQGNNEDRKVQITDFGRRLLRSPPGAALQDMLQESALKPKVIREFWDEWGARRPPDSDCRFTLTVERGFTDAAAATFLEVYDATMAFAGLGKSDIMQGAAEDVASVQPQAKEDEPEIAEGDLVQWVSQDACQFEAPRRVLRIVDNARWGKFASVEGYDGMLPLGQLELMEKMRHADKEPIPGRAEGEMAARPQAPQPLVRRHVFALEKGHAALELPVDLSPDVLEDIKAWLVVMIRRAGRSARQADPKAEASAGGTDVHDLLDAFFPGQEKRVTN